MSIAATPLSCGPLNQPHQKHDNNATFRTHAHVRSHTHDTRIQGLRRKVDWGGDEEESSEHDQQHGSESDASSSQQRTMSECSSQEECAAGALMAMTSSFGQHNRR